MAVIIDNVKSDEVKSDDVCKKFNCSLSFDGINSSQNENNELDLNLRSGRVISDVQNSVDEKEVVGEGTSEKECKVMKVILLGPPGAGKGTQAEAICKRLSIPTISTGNIIREALKSGTELGKRAKSFIDAGKLVPDEVVINIVKERIAKSDCKNGFILDGFPRTIPQAEALDSMGVIIDKVIYIDVPDEVIIGRMSGRRVCEKCGASYNLEYKKPIKDGTCDNCQGTLVQRKDDHPETVKERLNVYHDETEPLKEYYEKQGRLVVINGQGEVSEITKLTLSTLGV